MGSHATLHNNLIMKIFFSLFALFLVMGAGLFAQEAPSAEEIGKAYIENTGGKDAYMSMKNVRMSGTTAMQGMEFPLTILTAEGDKMRVDVDVQGQKIIQAYDGTTAWQVMPFQGITEPTAMSPEESIDMSETKFLSEFIDSEARGYKLESVEGKEVEGAATYGVRVTNEEGYDRTYYFDTEYMIPVMVMSVGKGGPTKGVVTEVYMSNYEETDGMMMPMFMDTRMNGQSVQKITLQEIEMNVDVDDATFSMPK